MNLDPRIKKTSSAIFFSFVLITSLFTSQGVKAAEIEAINENVTENITENVAVVVAQNTESADKDMENVVIQEQEQGQQVENATSSNATLHVIKHVINDNQGTSTASDATMFVKVTESGENVSGSPFPGEEAPGTLFILTPGTYTVSEEAMFGYAQSYSGDCISDPGDIHLGQIILAAGDEKTCTITNDDFGIASSTTAILHVIKHVVNDNGGTATASDATIYIKVTETGENVSGSPAFGMEAPGREYILEAGTYTVSEDALLGYEESLSGDCVSDPDDPNFGQVILMVGDDKTCTVTNDDIGEEGNHPPIWEGPTYASTTLGESFNLIILATDSDNDELMVTSTIPEGATYDPETGEFFWTPLEIGTSTASFSAFDGTTSTDFAVLLEVFATSTPEENLPPYFVNFNPPEFATATILYSYDVEAEDPENDILEFSLEIKPDGMSIASSTGVIEWTPDESQVTSTPYEIRVAVSDSEHSTSTSFYVVVNSKPVVLSQCSDGIDNDGDGKIDMADPGCSNPEDNDETDPPPGGGGGGTTIVVGGGGGGGSANYPPRFRNFGPPIFATATLLYFYQVDAYDLEHDPITYSLAKAPTGMIIAQNTGFITWYPTFAQVSAIPYEVVVTITDGHGFASERYFVTVVTSGVIPLPPPIVIVSPVEAEEPPPGGVLGEEKTVTPPIVYEEKRPSFFASLFLALGRFTENFSLGCVLTTLVLLSFILYLVRKNRKLREKMDSLKEQSETKKNYSVVVDIPVIETKAAGT